MQGRSLEFFSLKYKYASLQKKRFLQKGQAVL